VSRLLHALVIVFAILQSAGVLTYATVQCVETCPDDGPDGQCAPTCADCSCCVRPPGDVPALLVAAARPGSPSRPGYFVSVTHLASADPHEILHVPRTLV
jgi:hypothetical protein